MAAYPAMVISDKLIGEATKFEASVPNIVEHFQDYPGDVARMNFKLQQCEVAAKELAQLPKLIADGFEHLQHLERYPTMKQIRNVSELKNTINELQQEFTREKDTVAHVREFASDAKAYAKKVLADVTRIEKDAKVYQSGINKWKKTFDAKAYPILNLSQEQFYDSVIEVVEKTTGEEIPAGTRRKLGQRFKSRLKAIFLMR